MTKNGDTLTMKSNKKILPSLDPQAEKLKKQNQCDNKCTIEQHDEKTQEKTVQELSEVFKSCKALISFSITANVEKKNYTLKAAIDANTLKNWRNTLEKECTELATKIEKEIASSEKMREEAISLKKKTQRLEEIYQATYDKALLQTIQYYKSVYTINLSL